MKPLLLFGLTLCLLSNSLTGQNRPAAALLSIAIYEEEVSGNLDQAILFYTDLLDKYPDDRPYVAKALYHLGLVYEKLGKQKANLFFSRLINNYPEEKQLVTLAKEKLNRSATISAESSAISEQLLNTAGDLFQLSKLDSAAIEYQKVIDLVPGTRVAEEAQFWLGQCYFKAGKFNQALVEFNKLQRDYPGGTLNTVTELMIAQTQQAKSNAPDLKPIIHLDDHTILDPETGVRFAKILSLAGKNNIIDINNGSNLDLAANKSYAIYGNRVFNFINGEAYPLTNDSLHESWCMLSNAGSQVASITFSGIDIIDIDPETGKPLGDPVRVFTFGQNTGLFFFGINWSPDDTHLTFSMKAKNDPGWEIYTFSLKDQQMNRLTDGSKGKMRSLYSLDGEHLFFSRDELRRTSVRMINSLGGISIPIIDSCLSRSRFYVSSDNQWILFYGMNHEWSLYRLADKKKKTIHIPEEVGEPIAWSKEGNTLYFFRSSYDYKTALKTISVFGGPAIELGQKLGAIRSLQWAPDNQSIIAWSLESCLIIPLDNGPVKEVRGLTEMGEILCFSPDGSKVLILSRQNSGTGDLLVVPFSSVEGKVIGTPMTICKDCQSTYIYNYSWSPDGNYATGWINGSLWMYGLKGESPVELFKGIHTDRLYYLWSPNGKYIAYYARYRSPLNIIRISDGSVIKSLDTVAVFDWKPKSSEITVAYPGGNICSISLSSGEQQFIGNWEKTFPEIGDLKWSPDGSQIGIIGYRNDLIGYGQLYLMTPEDGKITEIAKAEHESQDEINWSPNSKWLAYATWGSQKTRPESSIWEADLTEFMEQIEPISQTINSLTLYPSFMNPDLNEGGPDGTFMDDRDQHLYPFKKIGNQIWMAENLAYLPEVCPDSVLSSVDKLFYVYDYQGFDTETAKKTVNYKKYGVLYNWPAVMNEVNGNLSALFRIQGICPEGWHLPTDDEFITLEKTLGMSPEELNITGFRATGSVDKKLESYHGWENDDFSRGQSGFSATPGGLLSQRNMFQGINVSSFFWTSTIQNDLIFYRSLLGTSAGILRRGRPVDTSALSVRCIKDN